MTEQEYIDASDLQKVRIANQLLRQIHPVNSSIIDPQHFRKVILILQKWEDDLYKILKVESTEE